MSLKRFNADVHAASTRLQNTGILGISTIEPGNSEGEVVLTFVHEKLPGPIPIRLIARDLDFYPDDSNFLLLTDVDNVPTAVLAALDDIQNFTFGQPLIQCLCDISSGLNRALDSSNDDRDSEMDVSDGNETNEEYDEETYDDSEYDEFGLAPEKPHASEDFGGVKTTPEVLKAIKQDLRNARETGCKVGILNGIDKDSCTHTISVSIRARKLGISDEALEAWDVEPSDYIVLLIRIDEPYPTARKVFEQATSHFQIDFRFGKCAKYKPSSESARRAFSRDAHPPATNDEMVFRELEGSSFGKIFISNSLEQFMNEYFISLFKLRLGSCSSWDEANACLNDLAVGRRNDTFVDASKSGAGNGKGKEKESDSSYAPDKESLKVLPTILLLDPFADSIDNISTPLVAMQFAIHYFTRCTEYCLQCHRRLEKEFEALKPFVCSDPLCLFQYITMGFGPSIEHEILTQPYVVDLLISLCYSSVQSPALYQAAFFQANWKYPIREFPAGLRLKVPMLPAPVLLTSPGSHEGILPDGPIQVIVNMELDILSVRNLNDLEKITADTWAVLHHWPQGRSRPMLKHHVYVRYADRQLNYIKIDTKHRDTAYLPGSIKEGNEADLFSYNTEFDDLSDDGKARAMVTILDTIPPISHLREYLIKNPHGKLRSYPDISPSSVTLLEWIVASNRSCILQVNPVADKHAKDTSLLKTIKTRQQEIIPSMGNACVQFRFAQGNPDKELRFQRSLKDLEAQTNTKFPTIFAWHGSSLPNWHSILRQGLNFHTTQNGRAFGNGVYFSPNYEVSMGYMRGGGSWPNSALNASGVMSLCEIINAPDQFVSQNPHYVVSQVDWIQCRYLFVQRVPDSIDYNAPGTSHNVTPGIHAGTNIDNQVREEVIEEFAQDPKRTVMGPASQALKIPLKALPSSRGVPATRNSSKPSHKRDYKVVSMAVDTDEEDVADVEALFSDDESFPRPTKRAQPGTLRGSSLDTNTAHIVTTKRPLTPPMTDFRPGTLDLNSIRRLELPQWADANSTRRLASDIKYLQKVQTTTPPHELGWYVHLDNIENMFQWIVELHSFDPEIPLAKDMKDAGVTSVVLEVRFGREYPFSPPFVRVVRPRFLPFMNGGGK